MEQSHTAGRNLAMEAVRVTEAAARAASEFMGRGDEIAADQGAVLAMSVALSGLDIEGTIRIGETSDNGNSLLVVGHHSGTGKGPAVDVALMPVEGPTIIAKGEPNGLSVIAMAEQGGFLNVPNLYMDKIAIGGGYPPGLIDIDRHPSDNLQALANVKGLKVSDLVVCILDRPRHRDLIAKVREAGARIMLISDGDVSGVIATIWAGSGIDMFLGIGGAPQGVLSAAALCCAGGQMQGRLVIRNDDDTRIARDAGFDDMNRIYNIADMAFGDVTFAATGVTTGALLKGVHKINGIAVTHSLVLRSSTGTLRFVESHHRFGHLQAGD